jgi:hypothetical protein
MKNRKREICTSGFVRGEGGNILTYSAARERGSVAGGRAQQAAMPVIGWLDDVPGTMEFVLPVAETGYVVGGK